MIYTIQGGPITIFLILTPGNGLIEAIFRITITYKNLLRRASFYFQIFQSRFQYYKVVHTKILTFFNVYISKYWQIMTGDEIP